MTKGLITAALMVSSIVGPTQAYTSTSVAPSAAAIANNPIVSVADSTMNAGDMASITNAMDIASTSALVASFASANASSATTTGTTTVTALSTTTQFTDNTGVMAYVKNEYADEPILIDIARCESSFRQYNDKTGDVLHGTADHDDIGVMQINEKYQLDKASSMGYDIDTVEGNVAYAQYLYDTQGAAPWKASQDCWSVAYNATQNVQNQTAQSSQALAVK